MSTEHVKIDIRLNLGTDFLINENAYFLGGILAANESTIIKGQKYWIAPVRHNKSYLSDEELEMHFYHVKRIADRLSNETLMSTSFERNGIKIDKFKKNMKGFATFFRGDDSLTIEQIALCAKSAIKDSSEEIKHCFIAGVFDGRGAIDFNKSNNSIRYISLDCNNEFVADILVNIINEYGFDTNYNKARDRLEGGTPRANQLRISDSYKYLTKIGFISQKKINVSTLCHDKQVLVNNKILDGLKTLY